MKKVFFDRLKRSKKYSNVGSFALWDSDFGYDKTKDWLTFFEKNLNKLKSDVIFVGLNPSSKLNGVFENFRAMRRQGGKDLWLKEEVMKTTLRGGYMTDLVKDNLSVSSRKVVPDENNFKVFEKELELIGAKNPLIVSIGGKVFNAFNKYRKNQFKVIKITHYAYRGERLNFSKAIEEAEKVYKNK